MSIASKIEWTDATWNWIAGCRKKKAGRLLDGRTHDEYPTELAT